MKRSRSITLSIVATAAAASSSPPFARPFLATTLFHMKRDQHHPIVHVEYPPWVESVVDWNRTYSSDEERMRLAVVVSRANVEQATGGPFGAAIFEALWSGVQRVVYGATREDASLLNFEEGPVFPESYRYLEDRGIEIVRRVLRDEARAVLELYRSNSGRIYNG